MQECADEEDSERREYEEDGGMISDSRSDEDGDDECLNKPESDSDENNNCTVFKATICLIMNRTVRREQSGTEEITQESQISYSEDVDPKDVDFVGVATDILAKMFQNILPINT